MGWEVKTDMGGQAEYGLLGFNVKTWTYLPRDWPEKISNTFLGQKVIKLGGVNDWN